jgi:hypothetical protein
VPFGTFLHSVVALVPHAYLLALLGLAAVVSWVARRRPGWDASRATRNFSAMAVAVVLVGAAAATITITGAWSAEKDSRADILVALAASAEPGDRIMSPDAGAYRYRGGWSGIVTPDDPLPVVEEALRLYDVRWLALERAHMTASLATVFAGETRPEWLSEPIITVASEPSRTGSESAEGVEPSPLPRAILYAVCLEAADLRCAL